MPIDYSKFDGIGSDDEDDDVSKRNNLQDALQRLLMDGAPGAGLGGTDPGWPPPPPPPAVGYDEFDDCFDEPEDESLDWDELQREARQLLLKRLLARPLWPPSEAAGAGTAAVENSMRRALLLETELHMSAARYRQAMHASLALQSLLVDEDAASAASLRALQVTGGSGAAAEPVSPWLAPALVAEMVASYQLGDRPHAFKVRDRLKTMDTSLLSQHLQKRFDGTSEVLDFMPQFLSLLKEEKERAGADADDGAAVAVAEARRQNGLL